MHVQKSKIIELNFRFILTCKSIGRIPHQNIIILQIDRLGVMLDPLSIMSVVSILSKKLKQRFKK